MPRPWAAAASGELMGASWEMWEPRGQLANGPKGLRWPGLHKELSEQAGGELAPGGPGPALGGLGM